MGDVQVVTLNNQSILSHLQGIIKAQFGEHNFLDWPETNYFNLVANAQEIINRFGIVHELVKDVKDTLCSIFMDDDLMVQNGLYLRAARPAQEHDVVGWHKESFYGGSPYALNVWMPVQNVTTDNAIRYIPNSAAMEAPTNGVPDHLVSKGSVGNKIGLLYEPKRILGGSDFSDAEPVMAKEGEVAIFPAELIHGAAQNNTRKIRFSVDCRVLARKDLGTDHTKPGTFIPLAA